MEGVEDNFHDIEWTIENFTCWNNEFHGMSLEMKDLDLRVYPKALSGVEVRVTVMILDSSDVSSVDLTFFHSEGTILYKKEISNPELKETMLFKGPKFTEITKKMKALQTETVIIRCRLHGNFFVIGDITQVRTVIEVSEKCFKVQNKALEDLLYMKDFPINIRISDIFFPDNMTWAFFGLLSSPTFSAPGDDSMCLTLQLYNDMSEKVLIKTYLSLLNCYGKTIYSEENECMFKDKQRWTFSSIHPQDLEIKQGFTIVIKLRHVPRKKPTHLYHLHTNKNYSTPLVDRNADESNKKLLKNTISIDPENSVTLLSKDLECLYQDQDFSDFEIRCGNTSIATHKNILSARSPVFKTMLSSGMKEAASNSMDILDMNVHTLGRFLSFLYTGTVKELEWDSALKLYYAADKYEIPSLKKECSNILVASVCVSNVCDVLSLGDKHRDTNITSAVHDFISENYVEVLKSREWESFMEKEPYLLLTTLTTVSKERAIAGPV